MSKAAEESVYLFSYFLGNGEDGLHLAWSRDGLRYEVLGGGRSYLKPEVGTKEKLMRDPCLVLGADGTFHMVWTCSWWCRAFGAASSRDLVNWGPQKAVETFGDTPGVLNCWAPEVVWDAAAGEYLVFWSTTIEGRFAETANSAEPPGNHRLYYTTTRDFEAFSSAKLLVDPGFNTIDGTFVQAGPKKYLIVKDESKFPVAKKHLRVMEAGGYRGPFSAVRPAFTPEWVEGPTCVRLRDGRFAVLYDCYTSHCYDARVTRDFETWHEVGTELGIPKGARHGSVIEVPWSVVAPLV